jgi:hypothetical protein
MYNKKTEFYGIPILCEGQSLSEKEETKKFNIIENQLLGATKGVMCCVFEEGSYHISKEDEKSFSVKLVPTGKSVALEGIVRGGYCLSKEKIVWGDLKKGRVYHLYVMHNDKLYQDEYAFSVTKKEHTPWDKNLNNYLYLAKVDLTKEKPVIDSFPDGKVYANDIASHATDKTNPHGLELYQDTIVVKKLVFEDESGRRIDLFSSKGGGVLNDTVYDKYKEVKSRDVVVTKKGKEITVKESIFNTDSKGKEGVEISVSGEEILSTSVTETIEKDSEVSFKLGQVVVQNVNNYTVKIYNNGEVGVPMSVVIRYK